MSDARHSFRALGLPEPLVRALDALGFVAPTPVQHAVIPAVLRGADVWASAETGSGKTAAFVLPILAAIGAQPTRARRHAERRRLSALVLAPTRELAAQIADVVATLSRSLPVPPRTRVVTGGVSINPQMMALRGGADLVIATPGRLLELIEKNALSLGALSTLVLDEADRLLDQGFAEELSRVLALVPARRQTLLFSATFPPAVQALAASVLRDPVRVDIAPTPRETPAIHQRAIAVDRSRRTQLLRRLIEESDAERVLVFVATTYATEHVADKLQRLGIEAGALHGGLSQGARTSTLRAFRDGTLRVLVATDVAARGLDVTGLPLVVNYDLPRSPTDYVHRIGRTGRAGASGSAVSFVTADAAAHFRLIEKRHGLSLARERIEGFEPTEAEPTPAKGAGGIKGKRKSKKDKLREAAAHATVRSPGPKA